jgi:ribosomal protein L24
VFKPPFETIRSKGGFNTQLGVMVGSRVDDEDRNMEPTEINQWVTVIGGQHKGKYGYITSNQNTFMYAVFLGDRDTAVVNHNPDAFHAMSTETYNIDRRFLEKRWFLDVGTRVEIIRGRHTLRHGTITKMNRVNHKVVLDPVEAGPPETKLFSRSYMVPVYTPDSSTSDQESEVSIPESWPSNNFW